MAGHARERRPGVWELRAYAGRDPLTGRKRYETKTVRGAFTKKEAQRQADEFAVAIYRGDVRTDMTFGELLEKWFAIAGPRMVPAGQKETRGIIDGRLRPLHKRPLHVIGGRTGTAILDEFYAALRERGGTCRRRPKCETSPCRHGDTCTLPGRCETYPCDHGGGAPLADATVIRTNVVVHSALEQAVTWGWIDRNPATYAYDGEALERDEDPPDPRQVAALFELAEDLNPELVVFLVLSSTTGQRRGAVGALWWEDVDLERGVVTFGHVLSIGAGGVVRVKRAKTKRNKKGKGRPIPLDPAVVAVLLAQRERCRARAALAGVELDPKSYLFAGDPIGSRPWYPGTVTRWFARLRHEAGIDESRLHDLRHFVVTYLLASGVDVATVKGIVGHSLASKTTERVYAHMLDENARAATGILARLLELEAPTDPDPGDGEGATILAFRPRATAAAADA